jgi:hypothetical protein
MGIIEVVLTSGRSLLDVLGSAVLDSAQTDPFEQWFLWAASVTTRNRVAPSMTTKIAWLPYRYQIQTKVASTPRALLLQWKWEVAGAIYCFYGPREWQSRRTWQRQHPHRPLHPYAIDNPVGSGALSRIFPAATTKYYPTGSLVTQQNRKKRHEEARSQETPAATKNIPVTASILLRS